MQTRYYQEEGIRAYYDYFEKYTGNPLAGFPTGTGKSLVMAEFLRRAFMNWPGQRAMVLVHVEELITQNHAELMGAWPSAPAGIFSAGLKMKQVRPITFGGIKSVVGKGFLFGHVDFIFVDECHLLSPHDDTTYQQFIAELKQINPKIKVLGLTATPYRLGQGLLTEPIWKGGKLVPPLFTDICYDITGLEAFNRLIQEGFLCRLVPKPTNIQLDVSNVKTIGGDFAQGALQAAVDKDEITYAAIQEAIQLAGDRKHWLVFVTGIRHCEHVTSMLDSCGVSAASLHSKTNKDERKQHVADFKAGKIRALVNPVVLTIGFNFPALDCIIDLAPTSSASRHVQKYGRGTRIYPGKKNCLVLDFAGNTRRNGPINDPVIPRRRKNKPSDGGGAPVKLCIVCEVWNHPSVRFCDHCGNEFPPPQVKLDTSASTETLIAETPIIGEQPRYEIFAVTGVDYKRYQNKHSKKPPCLKVIYHTPGGLRSFSEFKAFEHIGHASKLARDWWREAAEDWETPPPATIDEALTKMQVIRQATHLKVWINRPEPKVESVDYSGTAFGTVPLTV